VFQQGEHKVGVLICEDVWSVDPAAEAADAGADVVVVLNASPFHRNKIETRHEVLRYRSEETGLPFAYVNLVGGQDELVFDGASFAVNKAAKWLPRLPPMTMNCCWWICRWRPAKRSAKAALPDPLASVYRALVVGVRDYISKNGFPAYCWACPAVSTRP
jgi:NAD+ synthase (glutamine-hydrolysing)